MLQSQRQLLADPGFCLHSLICAKPGNRTSEVMVEVDSVKLKAEETYIHRRPCPLFRSRELPLTFRVGRAGPGRVFWGKLPGLYIPLERRTNSLSVFSIKSSFNLLDLDHWLNL